ncbi:MAG: YceI family protein [Hyphomicrobium sp.]
MTIVLDWICVFSFPAAIAVAVWTLFGRTFSPTDQVSSVVESLIGGQTANASQRQCNAPTHSDTQKVLARSDISAPAKMLSVLLVTFLVGPSSEAEAARFEFDQRRTEVRFTYKMAYSTQRGRFTKVSGTLDYDENTPEKSKIHASIRTASLTTGEALVDNELKGSSFFNVEESPVIAFKSLTVKPRSPTAAQVMGEITINGITKPVTLDVSLNPHDDPALKYDEGARQFIATTRIQRSAFNMTSYQSMVDDEIEIEIDAIVRPK